MKLCCSWRPLILIYTLGGQSVCIVNSERLKCLFGASEVLILFGSHYNRLCSTDAVHQFAVYLVLAQQVRIASDEQLLAGTSEGYIQFAVNQLLIGLGGDREYVQLIGLTYGSAVNDDVALATLVAFYGVDGDGIGFRDAKGGQFVGDHGYLIAERNNNAYPTSSVEGEFVFCAKAVYSLH